ncbi:DUF1697 domain-containing protein [Elizabethkingia meningoseptica]|uniref:DUF1697 domain-containing protein n=1 Tax=Elizabethkingia meningoseptica TaxID=238 RepID=A0A1V3TXX9_ELIME|nr:MULTISPECIES: DUF1697 domain-containing protein [Elizabethkingia]AQX13093.1 hypothetical protein BBD35_12240 [Elizabethkingia meningoseptica]EJK5328800.1 DUF1697 domain-containing protein [Elizabethkingia meningoseptica]MBG0514707.1 DUF1697 domain-containing protein [Elizabethkingia meningoseptica]MDE5433543.1 DUF1697 domain-containing protein [Elizabethkingia meningoseptica]MDE5437695.1 DUF1697 domain-containing protein [Elizabethkingia meningoseptica]
MEKYCAFLRGVNVKGTNMKMAEVCKVFRDAGMQEVSSVLASGNIIFSSSASEEALKTELEQKLSTYFDYEAFLFLRNEAAVREIISNAPFTSVPDYHNYVFITANGTEKVLMELFNNAVYKENESSEIVKDVFYWQTPKGNTLNSDFGKVLGKKSLKDQLTSRNMNTLEKIVKAMEK